MGRSNNYIDLPISSGATYPQVLTFADLPPYALHFNEIYVVETSTGTWPFNHELGFYIAGMSGWIYLSDFSPQYIKQLYLANPDTNNFDDYYKTNLDLLIAGTATANALVQLFDCDSDAAISNLVIADTVADNKVLAIGSNVYTNLVFGIIISKPTTTTCNVLLAGGYEATTGLVNGKAVFVGPLGTPVTTPPTSGSLQAIGIALSTTKVSFNFSPNKVILI